MTQSPHTDARLSHLFLDMLAAEQGAGANTLDAYRRDLADFSEFAASNRSSFLAADTQTLRNYLEDLDERGFKSTTVARRLSALRHLFRFLLNERHRSDDPAAILTGPKRGRSLPKVLSMADVDRMLTRARELADQPAVTPAQRVRAMRLYCMLELLYATGLRVSELVSLPITAARRDARMLVVRGKGDKERLVPLNKAAKEAMAKLSRRDRRRRAHARKRRRQGQRQIRSDEVAVSIIRRKRPFDAATFRPRPQGPRRLGGHSRPADQPARGPPRLRQPPAAQRRGPAHRANLARPHRHFNDANLYACGRRAVEKSGARPASAG